MNFPIPEFDDLNKIAQYDRIRMYFHESVECTGFASKIILRIYSSYLMTYRSLPGIRGPRGVSLI